MDHPGKPAKRTRSYRDKIMHQHFAKSILLAITAATLFACTPTQRNHQPPALAPGQTAPDFTLEDAHGGSVTLSQINKPTLLVFYLGYDCPRCVRHLRELVKHKAEFDKRGVQILAISPDTIATSQESIRTFGDFPFPLLSDPDNKTAAAYGLVLGPDITYHGIFTLTPTRQITFTTRTDHPYDNTRALLERFPQP
jgi:peroxiredoxin